MNSGGGSGDEDDDDDDDDGSSSDDGGDDPPGPRPGPAKQVIYILPYQDMKMISWSIVIKMITFSIKLE